MVKKANVWDDAQEEGGALFKFDEVGTVLEAILIEREEKPDKYNPGVGRKVGYYRSTSAEGSANFFSTESLDDQLRRAVGKIVRIEFVSEKPSTKGNPIKVFEVKSLPNTKENRVLLGLDTGFSGADVVEENEDEEDDI